MDDENNVFRFGSVQGGKTEDGVMKLPQNKYVVLDIDDEEWVADGFLVFTSDHIAIMKSTPEGAIPSLVMPLTRVKAAGLSDDDESIDGHG